FLQRAAEAFAHFRSEIGLLDECFKFASQDGERCAQFVRGVGHKPPRMTECFLEPLNHVVQRYRKAFEFVSRPGYGQAFAEIVCPEGFGGGGDSIDWRKRALDQKKAAAHSKSCCHGKPRQEKDEPLPEILLNLIHQCAGFDEITLASRPGDGMTCEKHFAAI